MKILLHLANAIDACTHRIGQFCYLLIPLMVLIGVWNAVGRFVGRAINQNLSSNAAIETQWYLFSIIFLLGGSYLLSRNGHVRVDVFYSRLSPRRQAAINALGALFFVIPFSVFIIFFSWHFVTSSWQVWEVSPDPGGLPRYPIKTLIPIAFILLIVQALSEAIENIAIVLGIDPATGTQEQASDL